MDGHGRHLTSVITRASDHEQRSERAHPAGERHDQRPAGTPGSLPTASPLTQLGFNLLVVLPNVAQGLFRRRPLPVRVATRLDVDGRGARVIGVIRDRADAGAVWLHVLGDRAVLAVDTPELRQVLERSPHPFASDPAVKSKGMSYFQPNALTLSRGELWHDRRRFTEAVLDTDRPRHRSADRFAAVAREETQALLDASGRRLAWTAWEGAFRRIARRIVLGDEARHDEHVTDLLVRMMQKANTLPSGSSPYLEPFLARVAAYVANAERGSLVGRFPDVPSDTRIDVVGQVPQWLFAIGDTLAINSFRALALLVTHPSQRPSADELAAGASSEHLQACLEEAMRLWPTTPLFGRVTVDDVRMAGGGVPAGTQVLISNTFNHRDGARHPTADRFDPSVWLDGDAHADWSLNHFSRGPQACPGAGIARWVGAEVLGTVLSATEPRLLRPRLDPRRPLPSMLDHFRLRFELAPDG